MLINMKSILGKIDTYMKSDAGKERKAKAVAKSGVTIAVGKMYAEELIGIIQKKASELGVSTSVIDDIGDAIYSDIDTDSDGNSYINIYFRKDSIHRDSLYISKGKRAGERTGNGIDNIIALMNNGYSASKQVYGEWTRTKTGETLHIGSKTNREPLMFIQESINEFNARHKGVAKALYDKSIYDK